MDNYKEMYFQLFNQITDAINELKKAQIQAEELYLAQKDDEKIVSISIKQRHTDW